MIRHRRGGFTLIEIVIALTLTGAIALMAQRLLSVTLRSTEQLRESQREAAFGANARAWLGSTLLSLEAGEAAGNFTGNAQRVDFSSWTQRPGGWLAPVRITLSVKNSSLVAEGATPVSLRLRDSVTAVEFDYLLEPGAETRWVRQWISPVSAPLAIRIRTTVGRNGVAMTDTLLLLVKERG